MDDFIEYLSNKTENLDLKKLIFPTILILIYVAGFVYLLTIIKNNENNNKVVDKISFKEEKEILPEYIYVDVKGSVKKPGVYKLENNSRVIDAINISGGLISSANTRYINLSKLLNDGDVIMVYSDKEIKDAKKDNTIYIETPCVCEEVKNDACIQDNIKANNNEENKTNDKININKATIDELKTLNGIGEAKAKAIIEYRTKNGLFKSIEELKNVSGISETIYVKIKENITT